MELKSVAFTKNIIKTKAVAVDGAVKICTLFKLRDVQGKDAYSVMISFTDGGACYLAFVNDFSREREFAEKVFEHIVEGGISAIGLADTVESLIE